MGLVKIEVQNDQGNWILVETVVNNDVYIRKALENSVMSGPGSRTKKARARDADTGSLIDIYQG